MEIAIAAMVIVILALVMFLKSRSSSKQDDKDIEDILDNKPKSEPEQKIETELKPEPQPIQEPKEEPKKKNFIKREVPEHGKITKDNLVDFSSMKILVAEDNMINQKVISSLFDGSGVEIIIADDGKEALEELKKDKSYAMVLMDANMPVMDGFEATKAIRANSDFDNIPVIGLSGDTAVDDIRKMQEAGMEECLAKPIVLNHLYDVLYKYTDESQSIPIKKETPTKKAFSDKELDFDKGLDISANDANFYNEILNEFITNYSDSAQRIQELLQNGNLVHAQRKLLDIIGVTANIGADNLHDISQDLKTAIEEKNKEKIIDSFKKYKQHLSVLLKEIEEYKAK